MAKNLLFAVFLWCTSFSYAQTIKTDVLVIGGTASGVAAAIQSARSKVKTLLIMSGNEIDLFGPVKPSSDELSQIAIEKTLEGRKTDYSFPVEPNLKLSSGILAEYRDKLKEIYKIKPLNDSTINYTFKYKFDASEAVLKGIADSVKGLILKKNATFNKIKKDGTGWEVGITIDGKTVTVKAKVVIDATYECSVLTKAGGDVLPPYNVYKNYDKNLERTSIAVADLGAGSGEPHSNSISPVHYSIPLKYVVGLNTENLLVTEKVLTEPHGWRYLPIQLTIGQGVGCIAAYCAFFKTTTKNLNVRVIQQELLDFKGYLMPYADIKQDNKYVRAVQQIGATGLLKRTFKVFDRVFLPDTLVTTDEIKPILNEIYSRAFIWFDKEKPAEKFTVGNTLSLISEFTLTDPKTLQATLQKDWQAKYGFTNFDTSRPITRLEFAVLVNQYLNPFARKIDLEGNIVN